MNSSRLVPWSHFQKVIINALEDQRKHQMDYAFLVCGMEGKGKSNVILNLVDTVDLFKQTSTPVENITFSVKEFAKASFVGGFRNKTLVMDEGKELEATNWQSKEVKAFKKFMTKVRMAGHMYFIAFPNPISMMGYLRDDKVHGIILCWANKSKTKYFAGIFNRDRFRQILQDFEKKNYDKSIHSMIASDKFNFYSVVPRYEGHLLEAYKRKKDSEVDQAHVDFFKETGGEDKPYLDEGYDELKKDYYDIKKACEKTGLKVKTMQDYVRAGKIKASKALNGRWQFDDESLEEFIKERNLSKQKRYGFLA